MAISEIDADPQVLSFRCTSCGQCCRSLRVAITSLDVQRLTAATGLEAHALVEWLAPDEVDMSGEPGSFVELASGRRLMVLAHSTGGCALLTAEGRCSAYPARPRDCRTFPFDLAPPQPAEPVRRLELLPLSGCDFARDGEQRIAQIAAEDDQRWQELAHYQSLVARWNRQALLRRRLRKRVGSASDFLSFALAGE